METHSIGIHDVHLFNTELAMHYRAISTVAIFGCFVSWKDFVAVFWSIFLIIKAKPDQSGSSFLFNLLCEWFFDRFLEKIEVTGQTGWE